MNFNKRNPLAPSIKLRLLSVLLCTLIFLPNWACTDMLAKEPLDVLNEEPLDMFVSNLTSNGTGLVRNVPANNFTRTEPISLSERSDYFRWIATDTGSADIRWLDCTTNLSESDSQILMQSIPNITFNSDTVWPEGLPTGFDPTSIMEAGKNPGLGVRDLHTKGITGKGVSIAIIDQTLFTDHVEYRDNIALYEEIHVMPDERASMHGSAVSSIAVGKNCGVAPDAKLYYWAVNLIKDPTKQASKYTDDTIAFDSALAVAVDRIIEINEELPENEKIRVISISRGFSNLNDEGVKAFLNAIERAKAAGIFVITTSTHQYYDFIDINTDFGGLGKENYNSDADDLTTYTLGTGQQFDPSGYTNKLLIPMDARTTADFTGAEDYVFYTDGGFSWVAPYLAGLYALSIQVNPEVTPELFWTTALDTASTITVNIHTAKTVANSTDGIPHSFNHVINPTELIKALNS